MEEKTTHFGYQDVPKQEKTAKVADVFSRVANKYDRMNDYMSLGMHRLWKTIAAQMTYTWGAQNILDLAGGTGDLSKRLLPRLGKQGRVVLADINASMLNAGRNRLLDAGYTQQVQYVQVNAEQLAFASDHFDTVIMGFGLRNVTNIDKALREIHRVLKPGGQAIVLEFSKPHSPLLATLYDAYSFQVIPRLGRKLAGDEASYRYLVESIRMHPNQEELSRSMREAQWTNVEYRNLFGGIVAIHRGYKAMGSV